MKLNISRVLAIALLLLRIGANAQTPPTVVTEPPLVTANTAQLFGSANPKGSLTTVYLEWGATTNFGASTTPVQIGTNTAEIKFSEGLYGLAPGNYFYRAVATNQFGRSNGANTAITVPLHFIVTRDPRTSPGSFILDSYATPTGLASGIYFEWGTNTAYGNVTTTQTLVPGLSTSITDELSGLPPGQYHFRAAISNVTGIAYGAEKVFTVPEPAQMALKLSGNDFVRTGWSSLNIFDLGESFTFEFWFNPTGPGVLLNEVDTVDVSQWDYSFAEITEDGTLHVAAPGVPAFAIGKVAWGEWQHLALVYDEETDILSAYRNGQFAGTSQGNRATPNESGREAYYCLGRGGATNIASGAWYVGLIDEFRLQNVPSTAATIASNYKYIFRYPRNTPGCWADYRFEWVLGGEPFITDYGFAGNHGGYIGTNEPTNVLIASTTPVEPERWPEIISINARAIASGAVDFQATVKTFGVEVDTFIYFRYGRSNIFEVTPAKVISGEAHALSVNTLVRNLDTNAPYEYRAIVSNAFGMHTSLPAVIQPMGLAGSSFVVPSAQLYAITNLTPLFTNKNITIEFFFFPKKTGVLASETTLSNLYDRSIIELQPSGTILAAFNGLPTLTLGNPISNTWNHVALRYDAASRQMHGFLNGVKSDAATGMRFTPVESRAQCRYAFGRVANSKLAIGGQFEGQFDEIRVWNRPCSARELTDERFKLLTGAEGGLILYWQGSPSSSSFAEDSTPHYSYGLRSGNMAVSTAPLTFGVRLTRANELDAQFVMEPNSPYRIERSPDLLQWTPVLTNTAPRTGLISFPQRIPLEPGQEFLRAKQRF